MFVALWYNTLLLTDGGRSHARIYKQYLLTEGDRTIARVYKH